MVKSRTIRIPLDLIISVETIISMDKELQYKSPFEFIVDAIRHRIEEVLKLNNPYGEKKKENNIISDFV
ncbi:hypothetical protein LCGC14_2016160 [marine sediment metagenome]|uniref:Uncharacterized protein n=1 Tax=marine sediment metagenome TaxID=412755 RepID=A0A0F9HCA5_9ZZZZ